MPARPASEMHIPGFAPQCRIQCRATDKGHKFLDQAPDEGHEFLDQAPEEGHGRRGRHGGGPRSSAAEGHGRRRISHKGHAPSRTRTPQEEVLLHKWDTGYTLTREDKAEIDALQESWRQQDAAKERRIEACMQEQEERRRKDSDELKRLRARMPRKLVAADSVSKPSSQDPGGDDEIDRLRHQPGNPRLMMRSAREWRRRVALGWHRVIRRRQCGVRCGTIVDPSGGQSFWRSRHVAVAGRRHRRRHLRARSWTWSPSGPCRHRLCHLHGGCPS